MLDVDTSKRPPSVKLGFCENDLNLIVSALREVHTPERAREMHGHAASVIAVLQGGLKALQEAQNARAAFLETITDEELGYIQAQRAHK